MIYNVRYLEYEHCFTFEWIENDQKKKKKNERKDSK